MLVRRLSMVGATIAALSQWGCSEITAPRLITTFEWGEVEDPETVVEGISSTVALGDFFLSGQFQTPSRCFELRPEFERSDSRLTVRIVAGPTASPNCDQNTGGFRYTASITNLEFGTYDLRVVHEATGGEFRESVTIR